jgi:hypothetical protein
VLAFRDGNERLMADGGEGGVVKDGSDGRVLAHFVELGTPFRVHTRGRSKGEVNRRGQESGKFVMPHHASARPSLLDNIFRLLRIQVMTHLQVPIMTVTVTVFTLYLTGVLGSLPLASSSH